VERFFAGFEHLGDREIGVVAGTSNLARDGHVIEMIGLSIANYMRNPIVLFQHQPDSPVGVTTALGVYGGDLMGVIAFAPAGASPLADQICSLTKGNVLRGISIGFDPIEMEPLDPKKGSRGGMHITKAELLEISVVSVPADTSAGVVARAASLPYRDAVAFFRSLAPVPRAAIERAAARVQRGSGGRPILSHSGHVWALLEAKRIERHEGDYSYETRQREAAELRRACGRLDDPTPAPRQRTDLQRKYCS
jgi:HK97 family phage prohead protease